MAAQWSSAMEAVVAAAAVVAVLQYLALAEFPVAPICHPPAKSKSCRSKSIFQPTSVQNGLPDRPSSGLGTQA